MTRVLPARFRALGLLQVCLAGVLWGTGGLVVTVLHERTGVGAMTVSAWRMAVAALALVGFATVTGRGRGVVSALRTRPALAVVLGCGTAAYQGLYFGAVLLVGVGLTTIVSLGLAPVLAAAWEHALARTTPSAREAAVVGAALSGLLLVTSAAGQVTGTPSDRPRLGLLLAVVSGAVYAATTVLGHRSAQRVDPLPLTVGATVAGALVLAPFAVVPGIRGDAGFSADPTFLLLLAYLGVATMAVAYGLLYSGLRTTAGSAATVATLVEPLSAAMLAALLLDERLTPVALVGGALILGAVVALRPTDDRPAPA